MKLSYISQLIWFHIFLEESELEKPTIKGYAHRRLSQANEDVKYEAGFEVPLDFGEVGAISVENGYHTEVFLQEIVLNGLPQGNINVTCGSWIHSKYKNNRKRVFFTNKVSMHPLHT